MKKKIDNAVCEFSIDGQDCRAWSIKDKIAQIEIYLDNKWQILPRSDNTYLKIIEQYEYRKGTLSQ